jgi:hypothetical protein
MLISTSCLAVHVQFVDDALRVRLTDGREIGVPLEWFPRLRDATAEQRSHWRLIGRGVGIHWEDLDEDLSVAGLLRG